MSAWEVVVAGVTALGAVGQVVVAVFAVKFARGANRINKMAFLQQRLAADLSEALKTGRHARARHRALFRKFKSASAKTQARSLWLAANEELAEHLSDLAKIDARIDPVKEAWAKVDAQDTLVRDDKLACTDIEKAAALRKYDEAHAGFRTALATAIRRLIE